MADEEIAVSIETAVMSSIHTSSRKGWEAFDRGEPVLASERVGVFEETLRKHGFQIVPVVSVELPDLAYEAEDYDSLRSEISDDFMGETGDLIREHAKAVIALRELTAKVAQIKPAPVADDIKRIDITEFREMGFLQEVNRQFLHPLGLALEAITEADGTEHLGGVWDYRDDPEGMVFGPGTINEDKALRVAAERNKHTDARLAMFRAIVQPIIPPPTECDAAKYIHVGPWEHVPGSDSASRCTHCGYVSTK